MTYLILGHKESVRFQATPVRPLSMLHMLLVLDFPTAVQVHSCSQSRTGTYTIRYLGVGAKGMKTIYRCPTVITAQAAPPVQPVMPSFPMMNPYMMQAMATNPYMQQAMAMQQAMMAMSPYLAQMQTGTVILIYYCSQKPLSYLPRKQPRTQLQPASPAKIPLCYRQTWRLPHRPLHLRQQ